jgi:propionyl-CoA carboxylase beta chain
MSQGDHVAAQKAHSHKPSCWEEPITQLANSDERLAQLLRMKEQARLGGGARRSEAQHERGKLTARERIDLLLDPGTFEEMDQLVVHRAQEFGLAERHYLGDAVVTGYGKVDGRGIFVFAQDFTILGGSLSEVMGEKIAKVQDLALKTGAPVVGLYDTGGPRLQEGVAALGAWGDVLMRMALASGAVPQIAVVLGPCVGRAAYAPGLSDFVFMTAGPAHMFVTGPEVIKSVTDEELTHDELGGAMSHAQHSGACHFVLDGEEDALAEVRRLLSFLPSNSVEQAPIAAASDDPLRQTEDLLQIVPDESTRSYDVRDVIERVVDDGDFMEVQALFAMNLVAGFARMDGQPVGIIANQPNNLAGSLDIDSARKAARFVRTCDAFNVPVLTLVDTSAYRPGTAQEYGGIITHGAKLVYAYAEATVPKVTVILRKAFGGAYDALGSKHLRADINLSWPQGEVAVVGPDPAVSILYRQRLQEADDPAAERARLVAEYSERFANPYIAAARGYVDDVIDPRDTRRAVIDALRMLRSKTDTMPPKKHGNVPL